METPAAPRNPGWSEEEDFLLGEIGQMPNLERYWNAHAKANKWPRRTYKALVARLERLGEKRRDEGNGWLTPSQLITALGLSADARSSFSSWVADGLPATKSEGGHYKVFLGDFARWVLSPIGSDRMAARVYKDKVALTWLLNTIREWVDKPNPMAQKPKRQRLEAS